MALADITLLNDQWWTVIDALRAFSPPAGSLATLIETEVPARDTDQKLSTTILGLTDTSQLSMQSILIVTPPPIFEAKVVHSLIAQQIAEQA